MQPITAATASTAAPARCGGCRDGTLLPFDFTMAFQPIVDVAAERIWGYEALVRSLAGEGAAFVLDQVQPPHVYGFDQACRIKAVELASALFPPDPDVKLSINFMPNAVYEPNACIRATLTAAKRVGFDPGRLMFEFTEDERMRDISHLRAIIAAYQAQGFTTAVDDFGAGYAGLGLLTELRPDVLKIDMKLVRGIDRSPTKRAIVRSIVGLAAELGITPLAEGIETAEELAAIRALGITLCQGYLLGHPKLAFATA
ncbi:EAL domain-containing protein [Sphingomonas sp. PAMC 26621]|uniref:EAL domain-containing protein n=1 Tax=Sphingomonas sp. PAMC 26621 TaxID=1112213 RepID=UPI000288A234|nr:EAL domain-containing protein [Sphingomonas sp. PAMC 26621]